MTDDPEVMNRMGTLTTFMIPFDVTGQPAIAIPAGFTQGGLPLGIQLVGHYFQEALLYRVAHAYETETGWATHHPPGL